jgi:chromosome segregation ATPase
MRYLSLLIVSAVACVYASSAFAITKCKDADGKWHYGDHAPDLCARSKVTQMNEHGTVVGEQAAPKTAEEVEQERIAKEREQAIADEKKAVEDEKRRLLNIYETVDDIDRVRDNQLYAVQSNIDVHNAYLNAMNNKVARLEKKEQETVRKDIKETIQAEISEAKENIDKFKAQLEKLETQKEQINKKFASEKEQYLALTNRFRQN